MKPLLFLVADYANITGEGKLNVMGIFNSISSFNFPARHSSMYLIAKLSPELSEYGQKRSFTILLMDADANHVLEVSGEFDIPKGQDGKKPEVNIMFEMKDVVFTKPGRYVFVLLIDKDQKDEITLHVNQIEHPKPPKE
ncbi:MAG: hypothetical protein AABZ00_09845 [Chloroflexota bacterium]